MTYGTPYVTTIQFKYIKPGPLPEPAETNK